MQSAEFHDPILPDVHARIRQAFLLGLARQPLAVPPSLAPLLGGVATGRDPMLALLALVGQRQRFIPPAVPPADEVPEAARHLHHDTRPVLPPPARRALARLTRSVEKIHAESIVCIAARRIGAAGFRLHPFDLPDVIRHIKSDDQSLGLAERAYLALIGSDSESSGKLFFERITQDNWTTFPKAQRRTFITDLRRHDPAAGRTMIESVWKTEPAPVRTALLEALSVGLDLDDRVFLEQLPMDRSENVKQLAASLLARIPSSELFEQRVAAAAQCFARPDANRLSALARSIGMGYGGLTLSLPGDNKNWSEMQATRDRLFSGLPLPALAQALSVPIEDVLAALPADEQHIVMLLLDTALVEDDCDTARRIIGERLISGRALPDFLLSQLADKARIALEPAMAERVLAAPAWADAIRSFSQSTAPSSQKDDGRLVYMATLMPRPTMPAFMSSLAPLPSATKRAAVDFAELVLALPEPAPTSTS